MTGGERSVALPLLANSTRRCAGRRSFRIRLHTRRADPLVRATVYVDGTRVRTLKGRRLRATVDLRGLPKGTFTVKVQGVTRGHRHVRDLRTYRTCVPRRASKK